MIVTGRAATALNAAVDAELGPSKIARALAALAVFAPPALILGTAGLVVCVRREQDRRRAPLAAEAARVLAACRSTSYTHEAVVDPNRGVYDVDCSTFVGLVLENVAPTMFAKIGRGPSERYPRASTFYDFLASAQPGWSRIPRFADAVRGDVICWRLPPSPAGDTGHVAIAAAAPIFDPSLRAWSLAVYDSSDIPHFDDVRERGGTYHAGVGTGSLRFRTDVAGRAAQVQFGPGDGLRAHPIVVARLDPRCR